MYKIHVWPCKDDLDINISDEKVSTEQLYEKLLLVLTMWDSELVVHLSDPQASHGRMQL